MVPLDTREWHEQIRDRDEARRRDYARAQDQLAAEIKAA